MATLNDLYDALQNQTFEQLRRKIEVAVLIKAQAVLAAADTEPEERVVWAKRAIDNMGNESRVVLNYLIGLNNSQTVNNLANDTDNTIKTSVNTAINVIYP